MASADDPTQTDTDAYAGDDITGRNSSAPYDLGEPAKDIYEVLASNGRRQQILEQARQFSELTITSAMPPQSWHAGDALPGNNQSVGATCVSTLASKLMFTAFPPGQPMMRLDPKEAKLQKEIDADPLLYAQILLSLSRIEIAHRQKAAVVGLATAYVGFCEQLLITGNCLWHHVKLTSPKWHRMDTYVVSRDGDGHPLTTILHEKVRVVTLPKDVQDLLKSEANDKDWDKGKGHSWTREADIYTVCRLVRDANGLGDMETTCRWEYWQETDKGTVIPDTEVETDYWDAPMWPGWLRPSAGDDWGLSYCEKYRGDLFLVEAGHSALNDGLSMAAWSLAFVKPGSRTSLKTVKEARNLSVLSGSADDMSMFRTDKAADFGWGSTHVEKAERRLGVAFLSQAAARREGERVTAEEVQRTGQELDQAMGGLYTQSAQGNQRRIIMRFVRLHEESGDHVPPLPPEVVDVSVVTGVDAMGRAVETQNLMDWAKAMSEFYGPPAFAQLSDPNNFGTRLAAGMAIKPEGLLKSPQQVQQAKDAAQQKMMQAEMVKHGTGPAVSAMGKAMGDRMPMPPGQGQDQPDAGSPPTPPPPS